MSKGQDILSLARTCIGKKYGSYYNGHRMDCSGLVRYCLTKLCGVSSSALGGGCKQQWEYFTGKHHKGTVLYQASSMLGKGKNISTSKVKAGDLLYKFNYDNSGNHHVMIANGKGGTVDASGGAGQVREKQPYSWAYKEVGLWVRMDEDGSQAATKTTNVQTETSKSSTSTSSSTSNLSSSSKVQEAADSSPVVTSTTDEEGDPEGDVGSASENVTETVQYDYSYVLAGGLPLTSVDTYKGAMTKILSQINNSSNLVFNGVTVKGSSLGFLYDLTHGGSFKFFLPEIQESYTANYESITIPGRSSDVQSYHGTASPTRTVQLQLMAGEGLYKGSDPVTDLYKDIAFVKSLCYPDYQSSIVKPPAIVLLYLGPESIIKGVVTSVTVNEKKPFTVDGRSMYVTLSFTVTQASDNPADYKDVRSKSSVAY